MYKALGLRSIADFLVLPYAWPLDSLLKGGIAVSVAALSWHFFERPINNLNRYFKYQRDRSWKRVAPSAQSQSPSCRKVPLLQSAQSQYIAISFVDHDHFAVRWKSGAYRIADLEEKLLKAILPEGHL